MKHQAFSPRAAAAAVMAVLLTGGTATAATAAVTSASAPAAQQSTPTAPGAPTGLTATPGNGTATLSWSPPSSDGGSPVDRYLIDGGTSPSADSITENAGGDTATIGGLTNGTTYYFRVHAQNAYGDGASATVQVTPVGPGSVANPGSVPGSPTGLKASSGDGFIALSWSAPLSTGGSPITGYHVYLGSSPSLAGAREFTTAGTSFRLTDAENGSQYYIKVTALNAGGEGPGTPVASVIAGPRAVPAQPGPPRPTGLIAQARHGEVVLSWSPPKGGLAAGDGYLIYVGTSPGHEGAKPSVPYLIQYVTSYTVAPLKDGTRYYFQVALLAADNQVSARSAEVSAVPGAGAGSAAGPSASAGATTRSGGNATARPNATPLRNTGPAQNRTSASLPAGLVILLAALVLAAAAGGATAIMLLRRRRHDRRYGQVPAPRRPHDDQPAGPSGRTQEMNGPRYR
jgi:Fibronectin type III domain